MGRLCIICRRQRPNEHFVGKGERARVCRRMPREKREAIKQEDEILGFWRQSHISKKNMARLQVLARSENARIAELAVVMLEVAQIAPYRRRRVRMVARQNREVLKRMENVGLIAPLVEHEEEIDWYDADPRTAWEEWERLGMETLTAPEIYR